MTIRELSDYLLELLSNNNDLNDCSVMIFSENFSGKEIHHLEMGFENDEYVIPECLVNRFENEELNQCLILFDHAVEFAEEKNSLASILGFKK